MRRAVLVRRLAIEVFVLLGAVLFAGVLLEGCGDAGSEAKGPGTAAGDKPGVGDTQDVGDLRVTLVEAFRTNGGKEDADSRDLLPPSGSFVVTRVRVKNATPKTIKWAEPYAFLAFSTDGRLLPDNSLLRQLDPTAPREDQLLYNTQIRPGGDVTGTLVFIAELDEEVSLELLKGLEERKPEATWEFGPVGELPEQEFESQL